MPLGQECWYLPMFGVNHRKKPSSIRVVFDSSARYGGVSLNDVLMKGPDRTQRALMDGGKLRLHKIASNSESALKQFDQNDFAKDLRSMDLGSDVLQTQRTLGVVWDIESDKINFQVSKKLKPYNRRGVLSMINSLFDPLGFVSPVTLRGKVLLREIMQPSSSTNWDDPLPESFREQWENWVESLHYLKDIKIPRMYSRFSLVQASGV